MIRVHILGTGGIGVMIEGEVSGVQFVATVEWERVQRIWRGSIGLVGEAISFGRLCIIPIKAEGVGVAVGSGIVLMGEVKVGSRRNMGQIEFEGLLLNSG